MIKFTQLTRVNQRKLAVGKKLEEHGICFERLSSGDGRYTINIMVDSQRIHRVMGKESEGVTRQQTEMLIAKLRTEARQGRLQLQKGRKIIFSFREAAEKYLEKQTSEGAKNLKAKNSKARLHLVPFFGNISLDKITGSNIECYKKMREKNQAKPTSINRELAVLSHLFTKAIEWQWLDKKPVVIRRLKQECGRLVYLTAEHLFIIIGLETSMRLMEILSIKLACINLERRVIYLSHAKAGAREQPITAHLAKILEEHIKQAQPEQQWLFPSSKSCTGHTVNINKPFRRIVLEAGLNPKEVVRHTLRHTAITHLVQAGVDLPTVKRISGHKTLQMVERYSHQNGSHIQAAMDKLEQRYHASEI